MEQWETVYTTNKMHEADLVKQLLIANGVDAVLLNQQDSAYMFGDIQIKVENKNTKEANRIINDFKIKWKT